MWFESKPALINLLAALPNSVCMHRVKPGLLLLLLLAATDPPCYGGWH
jgi:hypothetical protein